MSSLPRLTAGAVMAAALSLLLATAAFSQEPARSATPTQPKASCTVPKVHKNPNYVDGWCRPFSGQQVRLRADCKYYPDRYSAWKGPKNTPYNDYRYFYAGNCPFGIRGGIWETR